MTRYLFLCGEGAKRSPTAVVVAREIADKNGLRIKAEYGGANYLRQEAVPHLREQYDRFVVMEPYMADRLAALGVERESITCLGIPDHYERGDPALVRMLEEKLAAVVQ